MNYIKQYLLVCLVAGFLLVSCGEEKQDAAKDAPATEQQATTTDAAAEATQTESASEASIEVDNTKEVIAERDYNALPLKGYVASLDDLAMGGDGRVNAQKAKSLVNSGKVLVFVGEGQAYIVLDAGGNFASKGLIKIVGEKEFALKGTAHVKDGLAYFVAGNL